MCNEENCPIKDLKVWEDAPDHCEKCNAGCCNNNLEY